MPRGRSGVVGMPRQSLAAIPIALGAVVLLALAPTSPVRAQAEGGAAPAASQTRPSPPAARSGSPLERRRQALDAVRTWGIHLRKHHAWSIAAAPFDLMVIDYAPYRHLSFEFPFSAAEVQSFKRKPDGGRRLILAYLSIGEAEDYRYYWRREWNEARPDWLAPENPKWPGNFPARFWAEQWQRIIFGGPDAYLERILAAGFDGIYLDRADVYEEWLEKNPKAEQQMITFIGALAQAARKRNPEFLVVLQNAEELIRHKAIRASIDAIAKEDLYYGAEHQETANPAAMTEASLAHLRRARRSGLKVLLLEYLDRRETAVDARTRAMKEGFLPHFAERSLGTLTLKSPDEVEPPPTDYRPRSQVDAVPDPTASPADRTPRR